MRFRLSRHPRARATVTLAVALLVAPLAAESLKTVAPEEVGLSSERLARINAMMERHIEAGEIPGGVTLVARRGRIAHLAAHGLMDLESQRPMRVDAAFRIASMTKPITGVAIMMLLEEGRLTLADYLPRLGQTVLEFQPGSRWAYSPQAAHDTLGRIVEILSGMPFDQFLQQRLFEPLGMDPISFYATGLLTARMPTVYRVTADGLRLNPNPNSMSSRVYFMGSGGLITTAEEYVKFGQMLLDGGALNGRRVLSPRTVDLMAAPHIAATLPGRPTGEGYGLSVRVVTDALAGEQRISNGSFGWSGVYGTHFWVDPTEDIVALLMTQASVRSMRPEFENLVMQAIID